MSDKPQLPNSKELDHIVPLGVGGTHTVGNVRIICRDCNLRRPKDGSDYVGPIALWAHVDEAAFLTS
jgi:5-methylcytosine-specific restriction endonuclease McrA